MNSRRFKKITPKQFSVPKKYIKINCSKTKWRADVFHWTELLIITKPGLLCAGEQYFSKSDCLDCITPLKTSLATDSNDSDRCDNDSGKELKTIKLCNQSEKRNIQCKSGIVPLVGQSNSSVQGLWTGFHPQSEVGLFVVLPPWDKTGRKFSYMQKSTRVLKFGIYMFETKHIKSSFGLGLLFVCLTVYYLGGKVFFQLNGLATGVKSCSTAPE